MTTTAQSSLLPLDPDKSSSVTSMRVRFAETDLMGIVHHASYLLYFEVARVEWFRRRGVVYTDWAERGWHMAVVEANVRYLSPARFDEAIDAEATLTELRLVSMKFHYRILREQKVLAEGFTRIAALDSAHKLLRMPDEMRDILASGERR